MMISSETVIEIQEHIHELLVSYSKLGDPLELGDNFLLTDETLLEILLAVMRHTSVIEIYDEFHDYDRGDIYNAGRMLCEPPPVEQFIAQVADAPEMLSGARVFSSFAYSDLENGYDGVEIGEMPYAGILFSECGYEADSKMDDPHRQLAIMLSWFTDDTPYTIDYNKNDLDQYPFWYLILDELAPNGIDKNFFLDQYSFNDMGFHYGWETIQAIASDWHERNRIMAGFDHKITLSWFFKEFLSLITFKGGDPSNE